MSTAVHPAADAAAVLRDARAALARTLATSPPHGATLGEHRRRAQRTGGDSDLHDILLADDADLKLGIEALVRPHSITLVRPPLRGHTDAIARRALARGPLASMRIDISLGGVSTEPEHVLSVVEIVHREAERLCATTLVERGPSRHACALLAEARSELEAPGAAVGRTFREHFRLLDAREGRLRADGSRMPRSPSQATRMRDLLFPHREHTQLGLVFEALDPRQWSHAALFCIRRRARAGAVAPLAGVFVAADGTSAELIDAVSAIHALCSRLCNVDLC